MSRRFATLLMVCTIGTLMGCARLGPTDWSYLNQHTQGGAPPPVPRTRISWQSCRQPAPDYTIGIAISGGGSRAANFSSAVLEQLWRMDLLSDVNIISSVSGGSLSAAYFALHGDELKVDTGWEHFRDVMKKDYLGYWLNSLANPLNIMATSLTDKDRSDLMAEVFDNHIFDHAKFADLGAGGPFKPSIIINATDITNDGTRFSFTESSFKTIGSDLSVYPIARAVMASGAFPGIFSNVTLRNYDEGTSNEEMPHNQRILPFKKFIHLIDGGPADNLGLSALREYAQNTAIETIVAGKKYRGCLFYIIDSHVFRGSTNTKKSDTRSGFISHIVDFNFFDAIDSMLAQKRLLQLSGIGLSSPNMAEHTNHNISPVRHSMFPLFGDTQESMSGLDSITINRRETSGAKTYTVSAAQHEELSNIYCDAWHIALNNILHFGVAYYKDGFPRFSDTKDTWVTSVLNTRKEIDDAIRRIETSYRLTGISELNNAETQEVLYDAAKILVADDLYARNRACYFYEQNGFRVGQSWPCRSKPPMLVRDSGYYIHVRKNSSPRP